MYRLILATLITLFMVNTADARRVRQVQQPIQNTFIDFTGTSGFFFHTQQQASGRLREYGNVQMLAHPSGCPSRAFCGCGAAVAAWLRFPRTSPASGMVAARRGHVFVLRQHIQGNVWMVEDYNSGGRKSRIHPRSISGYTIVNPRA
jgi:hypothetical protein